MKPIGIIALLAGGYIAWRWYEQLNGTASPDDAGLVDTLKGDFLLMSSIGSGGAGYQISLNGLAHIKGWEGFRSRRYLDEAGKPTIGYGHLLGALEAFDTVTEAEAEALLLNDLATAEGAVNRLVKVALTQYQYDALVSFVFNVGQGAFATSTMLKYINQGKMLEAQREFMRWVYVKKNGVKVVSNGLYNRRAADGKLFGGLT